MVIGTGAGDFAVLFVFILFLFCCSQHSHHGCVVASKMTQQTAAGNGASMPTICFKLSHAAC
jgi:hypothetical protein